MTDFDILELVPRVQRSIEGVVQAAYELEQSEVYQVVADACADVLLYCGSIFGSQLVVTGRDPTTNAPNAFATSLQLNPAQASVIASQAALNYFFLRFQGQKTSESIADESSTWDYAVSPTLLIAQLKMLQDARDMALQAIDAGGLEEYISFLAVRDSSVARFVEPWVYGFRDDFGTSTGGQIDGSAGGFDGLGG